MVVTHKRLARQDKFFYSLPGLVLAACGVPLYVYVPKFYTDVVGVSAFAMGFWILAARLADAISDPIVGVFSDRTQSAMGRRRPFIIWGSVFLACLMVAIYLPPKMSNEVAGFWFGSCLIFLSLAWTLVDVPWESLGPEICRNYDERTELFGFREGMIILGTILAVISPMVIENLWGLTDSPEDQRFKFGIFGCFYGPLVLLCSLLCVLKIKEVYSPNIKQKQTPSGFWKNWRETFNNKPFRILLLSYGVAAFGANLPATLILYYVEYVLQGKSPEVFLLIYVFSGLAFLPFWMFVSKKLDKKKAWIGAMAINTGAFLGVFFLGKGDLWAYGVLTFISGTGFGASLVLPSSMQADVIDYDELLHGKRREGRFIGVWSIVKKASSALGMGVALPVLDYFGYKPGLEQTFETKFALRFLYCLAPCVFSFGAIIILLFYPLTRQKHQIILQSIENQKTGKLFFDPLSKKTSLSQSAGGDL